ncbi:putative Embryogenesis-associated protein EMB8 [Cardiosporidium cionae]|uniref:Embryogenesis-associated protein EMB8 n=1 Tax=Cardiosporidium cionae TaxID=476202 RepID=A0ABQ7J9I6_9APIC|nr:putative Embryogenesis-associated protein EMB8 [Cardiosporidium cionae]|eukprot:KAF8820652.1 putative Embryogenesis-associated protein EMB8 [Cardiosporidium cionae]
MSIAEHWMKPHIPVHARNKQRINLIISHMQDLLHGYKTAWIGLFRHFSTLIGYFKWKPVLQKTRQMVQNYDGTLLELDWYFCHQPKKAISPITTALNSPESKLWFAELLGSIPEMILSEAEYVFMKNYPPALQPFSTTYLLENSQDSTGKIIEENQGERMLPPNYRCDGIISPDFTHAENSHEKKEAISVEDTSDQKGLSPDKLSSFFIASNTPFDHTKSSREYRKSMMGSIYNRQEGVLSSTASPYFPPVVAGKGYAFDNVIGSQIPLSIAFTARPVFLAIHGINGHSEEAYIIQSMQLAAQQGWHAVAMNHRGCGKSKLDNVFGYSAGGTQDIAVIANEIRSRFPYSPFFAAGFSLGANLLAKYIGECGTNCPIDAAACCANPWNLKTCAEDGKHSYTKRIYENVIVMLLKRYIQKNLNRNNVIHKTKEQKYVSEGLVDDIMDYTKVWLSPDSIHGFDTRVTSRIFGYEDVSNYWVEHSSAFIVDEIRIPCLCLNSSDDPIVPVKAIPMLDLQNNPNILFVLSSAGGHLGWLSTFPRLMYGPSWGEEVVVSFFSALLPHIRMKMFRALVKFRGEHLRRVISGRNASNDHIQLENHSTRIIGKSPNALVHSHHTDQNSPGASGVVNIHEATLNGTSPLVIDSPFLNTKNAVDSSSAVANSINPSSLEMQPDFRSGLSNQPSQSVLLNAKL